MKKGVYNMGKRIEFTEEVAKEMKRFFEETISGLRGDRLGFYDTLLHICLTTQWHQAIEITKEFKKQYESTFKEKVISKFSNWEEGSNSICNFLKKQGAVREDSDAMKRARNLQSQFKEWVDELVSKPLDNPYDNNDVQVNPMKAEEEMLAAVEKEIKVINNLISSVHRKQKQKRDDNLVWECVGTLLDGILLIYKELFENYKQGLKTHSKDVVKSQLKIAEKDIADEEKQNKIEAEKLGDILTSETVILKGILF